MSKTSHTETTRSGCFIKVGGRVIWEGDPDYPAADAEMQRRFEATCAPPKTTGWQAVWEAAKQLNTERRCACVSYDAHECVRIRYARIDRFDESDWSDEECECACHAEFDEWNRDDS
jgi:hypothetical protein